MTDFGYCVLLLILGAVVVITLDTVLGIIRKNVTQQASQVSCCLTKTKEKT
jgi:hypothetical protein